MNFESTICNLSDNEIVLKIREGEKSLFCELVNRYDLKLRRYALRVSRRSELVDDIMQNVYMKVFKNLNGFNPEYKFNSWIYRIVHNEAVSMAHYEQRRICFSIDDDYMGVIQVECPERNPHERIRHDEIGGDIEFAMSLLKPKYAEVLKAFYFKDKTYKEISVEMDININTLGTLLNRARQELSKFEIIK